MNTKTIVEDDVFPGLQLRVTITSVDGGTPLLNRAQAQELMRLLRDYAKSVTLARG